MARPSDPVKLREYALEYERQHVEKLHAQKKSYEPDPKPVKKPKKGKK